MGTLKTVFPYNSLNLYLYEGKGDTRDNDHIYQS